MYLPLNKLEYTNVSLYISNVSNLFKHKYFVHLKKCSNNIPN